MKKKKIIKRISINDVLPNKIRPFNAKRWVKAAVELRKAIEKVEKKYGKGNVDPICAS